MEIIFVKEIFINLLFKIRIYKCIEDDLVKWFIGYPYSMLPKPLLTLAQTEIYLGRYPSAEIDGFYVFKLLILTKPSESISDEYIDKEFRFDSKMILKAMNLLKMN